MMNRFCIAAVIGVGIMTMRGSAMEADSISLRLSAPEAAAVGDALPLAVVFRNVADEPIYIPFSGVDYGAESLVVCARSGGRWYSTGRIHLDRDTGASRFDFIPLRRDQTFEAPILSINDATASPLPALRLPESGTYEIFATYTSEGSVSVGVLWPVWRGVVTSPVGTVKLSAPAKEVVARRLAILRECAVTGEGCDADATGYFTIVRDSAAAAILSGLLDKASSPDLTLIEAVGNQLGESADDALQRFATRFPDHAELIRKLRDVDGTASVCAGRFAVAARTN